MRYYVNSIDYEFIQEKDGWISVYMLNKYGGEKEPIIQAIDIEHAKSYCNMIEPVPYNCQKLI